MNTEQKTELLKNSLESLTETARLTISGGMPQKGDVAEDCQKIALLNAISELEACINGITSDDLQPDDDYGDDNVGVNEDRLAGALTEAKNASGHISDLMLSLRI